MVRKEYGDGILELIQGDITEQNVDAIVNAANAALAGGGGVDGAIHRKGGPTIMEECRRIGGCPTGQTVMTGAGLLPARYVLHTVGPVWRGGGKNEPELLASCYRTALALALAREHRLDSIAFPSVSTGIYHFPVRQAAEIALHEIVRHLQESRPPGLVRMVLFDPSTYDVYETALADLPL